MFPTARSPRIAIACGGTGGHLFPGMAVAQVLARGGSEVVLLVSPKDVDQQAVRGGVDWRVVTLPAVGLQRRNLLAFARGFWRAGRAARALFRTSPVDAVLAMGGFTSAPPVLAGKLAGAVTALHEANTIPGRANRLLAPWVDAAFVGFPEAAVRLHHQGVRVTGMPVREDFQVGDAAGSRLALGLAPNRPVLLVMGGSQGASGLNAGVLPILGDLSRTWPELQYVHLTGAADFPRVRAAYAERGLKALVTPFLTEMELALTAATAGVSRAGASALAESAAVRLPSVLVPFPAASDDHQRHNARAFVATGAALMWEQGDDPRRLFEQVGRLLMEASLRQQMAGALARWHQPDAAEQIAQELLRVLASRATDDPARRVVTKAPAPHRTPA